MRRVEEVQYVGGKSWKQQSWKMDIEIAIWHHDRMAYWNIMLTSYHRDKQ